jgi:4-hydroxybenzoate polyprenyltransferase
MVNSDGIHCGGQTPDLTCWLLYFGNLAWTVAYDTQYAITDREYDLKIGVKSTAILFGNYDIQIIGLLQFISLLLIGSALYLQHIFIPFGMVALLVVAGILFIRHIKLKIENHRFVSGHSVTIVG